MTMQDDFKYLMEDFWDYLSLNGLKNNEELFVKIKNKEELKKAFEFIEGISEDYEVKLLIEKTNAPKIVLDYMKLDELIETKMNFWIFNPWDTLLAFLDDEGELDVEVLNVK